MNNIKQAHTHEISKIKNSFAHQIDELQELLSNSITQIREVEREKKAHGVEFIKILNKAKKKHMEYKNKNKKLAKKISKIEKEFDKLASEFNLLSKEKSELDIKYNGLTITHKNDSELIKDLSRKLYRIEVCGDLINLDPYELHKKIRAYETELDLKEQECISIYKELKTLKSYLEILGITKKDLKVSVRTGKLNLSCFNADNFNLNYKTKTMK